ncbi:hypothetical protein [Amycolatopsis sp. NPDC004625]|uniref:hypothetical protein n=1 Tax=Amycolatopsis sp. NPDC004625 TaxID=3154670 RepID=UPI0033B7FD23
MPGDDDLEPVLRDLVFGRLGQTRAKVANSPETRAFLEIGLDLLRDDLVQHTGPDFETGLRSKLFESISRERILQRAAAADEGRRDKRLLTVNMFRYRWERKDRYTEDLISYMFRLTPQRSHLDDMHAASDRLIREVSYAELVRTVADAEVRAVLADPLVVVQTIVQNAMPNHPRVREFCRVHLDHVLPRWAQLYEKVTAAYGFRLRPAYTWLDIAVMFNAVTEGELVWARTTGRPELSTGDHVLAGVVLALTPALFENVPADLETCYAVAK